MLCHGIVWPSGRANRISAALRRRFSRGPMHLVRDDDAGCELTLAEADRIEFAGGSVTVSFPGPQVPLRLSVRHEGSRVGEIGFDGRRVCFSGEPIGVLREGGEGPGSPALRIELTAGATTAAVETLVENLVLLADPSGALAVHTALVTLTDACGRVTTAPFALQPAPPPRPRAVPRPLSDARPGKPGENFVLPDADADGIVFATPRS